MSKIIDLVVTDGGRAASGRDRSGKAGDCVTRAASLADRPPARNCLSTRLRLATMRFPATTSDWSTTTSGAS